MFRAALRHETSGLAMQAGRMDDLKTLLAAAYDAVPGDRIEYRNPIAAHGMSAIGPMVEWAQDARLAGFAVRVIGRVGQIGYADDARKALVGLRSAVPGHVAGDIDAELTRIDRQPVGPLQRPRLVAVAEVEPDTGDYGWVAALLPVEPTRHDDVVGGAKVTVIPLVFPLWIGPDLGSHMDCRKRKGRVRGDLGELSCGEVEVVKRFRRACWNAYWVSEYHCGEGLWAGYRAKKVQLPPWIQLREGEIRRHLPADLREKRGGRPDVVAWAGTRLVYVECKGPGDDTTKQERWLSAAAAAELTEKDLGIAAWIPEP